MEAEDLFKAIENHPLAVLYIILICIPVFMVRIKYTKKR